jgi:ATP-binding cassette subfamily B (MDR/TAP) protein 1
MLIASKNMSKINNLKNQLSCEFKRKDLNATKKILYMKTQRDQKVDKLYLSQRKYLEKVLECFGIQDCKLISTLLTTHFKLSLAL